MKMVPTMSMEFVL